MATGDAPEIDIATAPLSDIIALAQQLSSEIGEQHGLRGSTQDATIAVEQLVDLGTVSAIDPRTTNIPRIFSDLLDWGGKRATKPVKKAITAQLMATRNDASLYPHAVERVSELAVFAPLLQPDRLARLMAKDLPLTAFAPVRYPGMLHNKVRALVGHYREEQLEQLLSSLLDLTHSGRWWDQTNGLGRPPRRRHRSFTFPESLLQTMDEYTRARISRLCQRPHYSEGFARELSDLRLPDEVRDALGNQAIAGFEDPDAELLLAALVDLPPGQRPENPLPQIIDALEFSLGDADIVETLPNKPETWADLYPEVELEPYPIEDRIAALDGLQLPDTGDNTRHAAADLVILRNGPQLFENRDHMGNCTGSYHERCLAGRAVIGKIVQNGEVYNVSFYRRGEGRDATWVMGELNSRYNRGGVPDVIREGVNQLFHTQFPEDVGNR